MLISLGLLYSLSLKDEVCPVIGNWEKGNWEKGNW